MTANYIQNRTPTNALPHEKTPFDLWHKRNPSYTHLRVFGCHAWVQTPSVKRVGKLDNVSRKMIFVGYGTQEKGYRFWDPERNIIVLSRDARFMEDEGRAQHSVNDVAINEAQQLQEVPVLVINSESDAPRFEVQEEPEAQEGILVELDATEGEPQALDEPQGPRRSRRRNKGMIDPYLAENYVVYAAFHEEEPTTYKEAMKSAKSKEWIDAMQSEISAMKRNDTWELVELPAGKNLIGSKWIFKEKIDENGQTIRFKARLVAQGFSQRYGVDFLEVFAPVVQPTTIRLILILAAKRQGTLRHIDVKNAFLNGSLDEEIYMKQPPGFVTESQKEKVCRLNKSIYGLKQAARSWNLKLSNALSEIGFTQSNEDECLFMKNTEAGHPYIIAHVDDMLVMTNTLDESLKIENDLSKFFEITCLGPVTNFLGVKIDRLSDSSFLLSQTAYLEKLMHRFQMQDAKASKYPLDTSYLSEADTTMALPDNLLYRSLIGCLLYISVHTRPDIAAAVSILSRRIANPTQRDWNEAKRVLRYLKGTKDFQLTLGNSVSDNKSPTVTYVDADWAGDRTDCKSNSGFITFFQGSIIGWFCRKQDSVSLSSTEAEYIAISEACKRLLPLKRLFVEVNCSKSADPLLIREDNQGAIQLVQSGNVGRRSKHIDTRVHFVRDLAVSKTISLEYCPTEEMIADMMTKPLGSIKLAKFRALAGVRPPLDKSCTSKEEC